MTTEDVITLRAAQPEDHGIIVQLMHELIDELGPDETIQHVKDSVPDDIRAALHSENIRIFIATTETQAIGLSRGDVLTSDPIFRLRPDRRCGYVDQMYVKPRYRRCGVGRRLLEACEGWFKDQGIRHVLLHAAVRAVRFYAQSGYQSNREMFKRI